MDIVIIGHNEAHSIPKMLKSLRQYDYRRIWVLDRCSDDSYNILVKEKEFIIQTPGELLGRQTSYSRNLGLQYADGNKDILFLDGDRYLCSGDLKTLENSKYDIELLYLQNDFRDSRHAQNDYGRVINGFYSCGMFMKREAIRNVKAFQNGKLFNEDIQDVWGIEDTYLGDVCYHLSLSCNYNSSIRLHGHFEKTEVESTSIIERRFKLREKLNVIW